jgi:hypothetical protein
MNASSPNIRYASGPSGDMRWRTPKPTIDTVYNERKHWAILDIRDKYTKLHIELYNKELAEIDKVMADYLWAQEVADAINTAVEQQKHAGFPKPEDELKEEKWFLELIR